MIIKTKKEKKERIRLRQRKRISGTPERPRLAVFRSEAHIYTQVIDDTVGKTIAAASSVEPSLKSAFSGKVRGSNLEGAKAVGAAIAERLKAKGVTKVVFDRGGFLYHGRIRAVADAARAAGLDF